MSCECFDWRVELVGFKKEGLSYAGKFLDNVLSRGKELPGNAYFQTELEKRVNSRTGKEELFWKGYERSVSASMRRNVAWLRLHKAAPEKIAQAKAEYKAWQQMEEIVLGLGQDEAVQFLALRGVEPEEGVALQQVSWVDGQLMLESQILPLNKVGEIEKFVELLEYCDIQVDLQGRKRIEY